MDGPARPLIQRAILVRAEKPTPEPRQGVLHVVLYHKKETPCLVPEQTGGVRVELHFADGLGSEVWHETRRWVISGRILTLELDPYRRPSLGETLLIDCVNPRILRVLEGFTILAPNMPDLRFLREAHPESTMFLPESPTTSEETAMGHKEST